MQNCMSECDSYDELFVQACEAVNSIDESDLELKPSHLEKRWETIVKLGQKSKNLRNSAQTSWTLVADSQRNASAAIADLKSQFEESEIRPTLSDSQLSQNTARIQELDSKLIGAKTLYNSLVEAVERATPYADSEGEESLHTLTLRAKEQVDRLSTSLQESKSLVGENKVKLQQFHDLETEVSSKLESVQEKAKEPTTVVFGASIKPAVTQLQNVSSECAHTQATTQKLSSFIKSWSGLPVAESREYSKAIKSTLGELASTQRSLEQRTEALDGLANMFDDYHKVKADITRLNSKLSMTDLDNDSLTRIQAERAGVTSTLNKCLEQAQTLDDKVSGLEVVVRADTQTGPAVELYDHTKKLTADMSEVDGSLNSMKSAARQAEEIRQMAASTAVETEQTIGAIDSSVKEAARQVRMIDDLKGLESELQVSRKKVKRIKGREVEDMKKGLTTLTKMDVARAKSISTRVGESVEQVEKLDSSLSSQEEQCKRLVDLWSVYEQSYEELEALSKESSKHLAEQQPSHNQQESQAKLQKLQAMEAALANQKLQVEYVTAKGQQVETEVRQLLPEFVPDHLRLQTANLNQQWSAFEQDLQEGLRRAESEQFLWKQAESMSKSISEWINEVGTEHETCDTEGGSIITASKVSENYSRRVDEHRDKLDKLRAHAEQIQQLADVSQLPELEESITEIEEKLVDAEQKNEKLTHELEAINAVAQEVTVSSTSSQQVIADIQNSLQALPSAEDDATIMRVHSSCKEAAEKLAAVQEKATELEQTLANAETKYKLAESSEAKRELASLSQGQVSLSKAISLKQNAIHKMADNNFQQAQHQYQKDLRLYEQSLSECESVPNNSHSVGARLQLISNLEAQLVHSAAAIQNMNEKSEVLKSLQPDADTSQGEVTKAKSKMEDIKQQLEEARTSHENWQQEIDEFAEASSVLGGELKHVGETLQSLSNVPFFRQAKQHQMDKLEELEKKLKALDENYQATCGLAQAVHCPVEQTQAMDAISKHRTKIHSLSQAIQTAKSTHGAALANQDSFEDVSQSLRQRSSQMEEVLAQLGQRVDSKEVLLGQLESIDHILKVSKYAVSEYTVSEYAVSEYAVSEYTGSEYAVSEYAVSEYAVSEYAVSEYAVSEYAVSEYAVSEYAVSEYAVSEYAVSEYAVSEYAVSEYAVSEYAVSEYAVSEYAVSEYTVSEYTVSEYTVSEYTVSEYTVSEYTVSEYTVSEYTVSEYTVSEYTVSEYTISEYTVFEYTVSEYTVSEYKVSEYTVSEYTVSEYTVSEYAVSEYAVSEYTVSEYTVSEYTVSEYAVSEYTVSEYAVSEYTVSEYTVSEYTVSEYTVSEYTKLQAELHLSAAEYGQLLTLSDAVKSASPDSHEVVDKTVEAIKSKLQTLTDQKDNKAVQLDKLKAKWLSYDEAYEQLKLWLDGVKQQINVELPFKGTLIEKQEQLDDTQVNSQTLFLISQRFES
ncbi:myosin heavy chain, skeletal muscle-like [Watersipora subatra]|uniref:myosin heavy chain, skeletal muscle-like n=1 Tax=Watersipora subatra TaxID=2589382 RepID=UPI00355B48B1